MSDTILRAVLVGCGGRGCGAANDFLQVPGTKIAALADMFPEPLEHAAKRFNVPCECCFTGFDAYRKAMEVDCDVVLLASPPGFRPIHFKAAVEMGKHAFLEKPCCSDAPGFRMLCESGKLANEKNLKVCVGLQRHHEPRYTQGIQEIANGKYGKVLGLLGNGNRGWYCLRTRYPDATEMAHQVRAWNHFTWLGTTLPSRT